MLDNTLDAQIRFTPAEKHQLTLGATGRLVSIDAKMVRPIDLLGDRNFQDQWFGLYGIHNWAVSDRVTLESQLRGDWYSRTTLDWSGRVAMLVAADEAKHHVFRFAGAKAFRAPQVSIQEIATRRLPLPSPPLPPGLFGAELVRAGELDNEQIWSLEVGYAGRFDEHWSWRIDGYIQRYTDLTGGFLIPDPLDLDRFTVQLVNRSDADARGIETELGYDHNGFTVSAWYAVNDFDIRGDPENDVRAFLPAKHKVGARARAKIQDWWTVAANYRYTGVTSDASTIDVRESHRLDLTSTFSVADGKGEIQLGVSDVFDETDIATNTNPHANFGF